MRVVAKNGQRTRIFDLDKIIAQGGAGAIYSILGHPELVAKIYMYPNTKNINYQAAANERERIEAMIGRPPIIQAPAFGQYHQLAWPLSIIESSTGQMLGFTMPKLALDQACDLESLITANGRKAEGLPNDYRVRVFASRNVATLIREIHREGHFIVDMKPKNMSIYKPAEVLGLVAILDSDGFSINSGNGKRYPAAMFSSEYISPELLRNNSKPSEATEYHDRWALSVIIFRLLNNSTHPYTGVYAGNDSPTLDDNIKAGRYAYGRVPHKEISPRPGSIHEYFDDDTRDLFDRAFGSRPHERPSAKEWRDHLTIISEPSRLLNCKNDSAHWHFSKGCPLCNRNRPKVNPKSIQKAVPNISANYKHNINYTVQNQTTTSSQRANRVSTQTTINQSQQSIPSRSQATGSMNPIHTPPPVTATSTQTTSFTFKHLLLLIGLAIVVYYFVNKQSNPSSSNHSSTQASNQSNTSVTNNAPSDAEKFIPIQDKFQIIKKASNSSEISRKSIEKSPLATKYFPDIIKDIVYEFNHAKVHQEDGLSVYQHINLSYLRKISFSGHEDDNCDSRSVGTIAICMIEGTIARCQFVEDKAYKAICPQSFQ